MSTKESLFISYAWGGPLPQKEWLRDQVIRHLELYGFSIFWDRDSIQFGQSIDRVIRSALSTRPLSVVCICDADYIDGARRVNSGLFRELAMIAEIAGDERVRILPVILGDECAAGLPEILIDRMYLDLRRLHSSKLELGTVLGAALLGASQVDVSRLMDEQVEIAGLWARARNYFGDTRAGFDGHARTHVVKSADGKLLLAPAWMHGALHWSNRMADDVTGFCPSKGIWHWDHWTPSTGMRALGAAAMSALFPTKTNDEDIAAIEYCGDVLAVRIFSMTKKTEHLRFDWEEIIQCVIASGGTRALDRLLPER